MLDKTPLLALPDFSIYRNHYSKLNLESGVLTVYESYVKHKPIYKMIFSSSNTLNIQIEKTRIIDLDLEKFLETSNENFI
jgi:hypothetical protein